jgi:hypothetical protein
MRVVRMLAVRDEADVLAANLCWYAEAGIDTVAVDNGSVDGSAEMLEDAVRAGSILRLETVEPTGPDTDWRGWSEVIARLQGMAARERPDLVLLASADEFFEVGDGPDLLAALEEDLRAGWTVFEFKNMEFHMTNGDPDQEDVRLRLRYYSLWDVEMFRGVRWEPGIDFTAKLGHRPVLPHSAEWRLSPRLYVSRHYPLRSREQATRKVSRLKQRADRPGASTHYLRLVYGSPSPLVPRRLLTRYDFDHRWNLEETLLPWRLKQTARALSNAHLQIERLQAGGT